MTSSGLKTNNIVAGFVLAGACLLLACGSSGGKDATSERPARNPPDSASAPSDAGDESSGSGGSAGGAGSSAGSSAGEGGGGAGDSGESGSDEGGSDAGDSGAGGSGAGGSGVGGSAGGGTGGSAGVAGVSGTGGTGGAQAVVNCVKALYGRYALRDDGALLYEVDPPSTAQTPILDAATALPLADVVQATEGYTHGCAVLGTAKTAWCWRTSATGNSVGQLGNGTIDTSGPLFRATQVLTAVNQPLTNIVAIAQGTSELWNTNACAVTADGKLYCWGNTRWIANNGTAISAPYAVPITIDGVTPLTGVLSVTLGSSDYSSYNSQPTDACAVVQGASSKKVLCWGANLEGNLGTGDVMARQYPTEVGAINAPSKVVAFGHATTCVLDGMNVRCWGGNGVGQTGNGAINTPLRAATLVTLMGGTVALDAITDIRGGSDATRDNVCALAMDHTLKCWGASFKAYPTNYGVTNILALGSLDTGAIRFMTSDGLYHIVANTGAAATIRAPNCGLLN